MEVVRVRRSGMCGIYRAGLGTRSAWVNRKARGWIRAGGLLSRILEVQQDPHREGKLRPGFEFFAFRQARACKALSNMVLSIA